jgi:D-aminoacyl-tRNA deacylase
MRAVVQRVARARVTVEDREVAFMVEKIAHLRIFADADGKMNRSVLDIGGGVLAISQFTLYGDARKGRRPAFIEALEPAAAEALYESFLAGVRRAGVLEVAAGVFRADMAVELVNDGPVTILLDSAKTF